MQEKNDTRPFRNPWWAIWYRQVNQWVRREFYRKLHHQRYQEILRDLASLAGPKEISEESLERLSALQWEITDQIFQACERQEEVTYYGT